MYGWEDGPRRNPGRPGGPQRRPRRQDGNAARRGAQASSQPASAAEGEHRATMGLAYGLGWFSIGLGLAEVLAPKQLARALGMPRSRSVLRAYGVREIATGVAILGSADPTPWIWTRVAGDVLNIATLAPGLSPDNSRRGNVAIALAAVLGATAADVVCARRLSATRPTQRRQEWASLPPPRDFSDRSGLPKPAEAMRGAASDFEVPRDFRTPEALRPWTDGRPPAASTPPASSTPSST